MLNKSHRNSRDEGVNFPLVGKYHPDDDWDSIDCQYVGTGAGYTIQGVVHFNVEDDAHPSLKVMTKEQSDTHIVGVLFAQHFSLGLFGGKVDAAIHKKLS